MEVVCKAFSVEKPSVINLSQTLNSGFQKCCDFPVMNKSLSRDEEHGL